jgi:hypothetical protein
MTSTPLNNRTASASIWRERVSVVLLLFALLCHAVAAVAIGGTFVAWRDHLLGFVLLVAVFGAVFALLGRFFWRGRRDITLLLLGLSQAFFGIFVYITRHSVHG